MRLSPAAAFRAAARSAWRSYAIVPRGTDRIASACRAARCEKAARYLDRRAARPPSGVPTMTADLVTYIPEQRRVRVVKANGNTYYIASYDNSHQTHRRGGFVVGDVSGFRLSRDTKARVLRFFYPNDSLAYLRKHGYIAS